jgi:hypothetical protein
LVVPAEATVKLPDGDEIDDEVIGPPNVEVPVLDIESAPLESMPPIPTCKLELCICPPEIMSFKLWILPAWMLPAMSEVVSIPVISVTDKVPSSMFATYA